MPSKRQNLNEWQTERSPMRSTMERDELRRATPRKIEGIDDNPAVWDLRRNIVERPDDEDPRRAYEAWLRAQPQSVAKEIANFIAAQLRVAAAFRLDPRADVTTLRNWSGADDYVSVPAFRSAAHLRKWMIDDVRLLFEDGLIGWPQFYRGAIERVTMRAQRFLEFGEEVFDVAPIRHLVLTEVPSVVSQLAQSPLLARIRSLSLPASLSRDLLTDTHLATLVGSPHLGALVHVRLVQQGELTEVSYERLATAQTLPRLSCLEVFRGSTWNDRRQEIYAPIGRRDRLYTRDTTYNVRRSFEWIAELELDLGHMPCLHPETYYRAEYVDLESVVEHPIACDPQVMRNRGHRLIEPAGMALTQP
jgi:hypothetical protein